MKRLFTGFAPFLFGCLALMAAALFVAPAAMANGTAPAPEPKTERPEPGKASAATSADLCQTPTSVPPAGYAPDAKTWPCRNFSK